MSQDLRRAVLDPYLLLSFSLLESPQLYRENGRGQGYEYGYGDIPIDALPLYDMLGCIYKKPKDNSYVYATEAQVKKFSELYNSLASVRKLSITYSDTNQRFRNFVISQSGGSDGMHIYNVLKSLKENFENGCPIADVKREISDRYCSDSKVRQGNDVKFDLDDKVEILKIEIKKSQLLASQDAELSFRLDSSTAAAIIPNKKISEFKLPGSGTEAKFLCSDPSGIAHGARVSFLVKDSPTNDACCAKVVGYTNQIDFLNFMAAQFVRIKLNSSGGSLSTLSLDIQKYNGLGVIGSTEGVGNSCLNGMNMKDRPYYGARAADLIINSLMSNAEINTLVNFEAKNLKIPIQSTLCQKLGKGSHQIERNLFFEQQKDFLLKGRPAKMNSCSVYFK